MLGKGYTFSIFPGHWVICKLPPDAPIPAWALAAKGFFSVTRTPEELSLLVPRVVVPAEIDSPIDWSLIKLHGPFSLAAVGVMASFLNPLAAAGISVLAESTYDTDYILVRAGDEAAARQTLILAGHTYVSTGGH